MRQWDEHPLPHCLLDEKEIHQETGSAVYFWDVVGVSQAVPEPVVYRCAE